MMGAEGFGSDSVHDTTQVSAEGYGASAPTRQAGWPFDRQQALEMGKDSEKLRALRGILAETSQGDDMKQYFPSVVKLVGHKDLEVVRLACGEFDQTKETTECTLFLYDAFSLS